MCFYAQAQLVVDALKHGVEVRPIDVNASEWDCTLEEDRGQKTEDVVREAQRTEDRGQKNTYLSSVLCPLSSSEGPLSSSALRLGLRLISGLSSKHAELIVARRGEGP